MSANETSKTLQNIPKRVIGVFLGFCDGEYNVLQCVCVEIRIKERKWSRLDLFSGEKKALEGKPYNISENVLRCNKESLKKVRGLKTKGCHACIQQYRSNELSVLGVFKSILDFLHTGETAAQD